MCLFRVSAVVEKMKNLHLIADSTCMNQEAIGRVNGFFHMQGRIRLVIHLPRNCLNVELIFGTSGVAGA
jgi:hypothetical protein